MTVDAQRCDRSASTGCCGQNILSRLTPRLIPSSVLHVQACPRSKEFGCVVYGSMILAPPTCLGAANVPWVIFRWMLCARGGHCLSSQYILIQLRPSSSHSQLVVSTRRPWNDATRALSPGGGAVWQKSLVSDSRSSRVLVRVRELCCSSMALNLSHSGHTADENQ